MNRVERLERRYYCHERGWIDGTMKYGALLCRYIAPRATVLDVGPGPGTGFSHRQFLEGRRIIGIDPDPAVLSNCSVDESVIGTAEDLPFEDMSFDAVVSNYVLEHIVRPRAAAAEIARVLRPGGYFLFRTPNRWHYVTLASLVTPHWLHKLLVSWLKGREEGSNPCPAFYRCNTREVVRRVFCAAGLAIEVLETIEAEPAYLRFSRVAYRVGLLYERLVNRYEALAPFRANILGVLRRADKTTECGK